MRESDLGELFAGVFWLAETLVARGDSRGFFFMRKDPGLRLRFSLIGPHPDLGGAIESTLDRFVRSGAARRWFPSVYEPETFKFGGPEALDAVHAYFFADSMAWWQWEQRRGTAHAVIDDRLLSVAVLNDLFGRFLDGPEEVWDVWCHVARLHGAPSMSTASPVQPVGLRDLFDGVSGVERAVLEDYSAHNDSLARRFDALRDSGSLLYADRLVLPHIALYHWNRFGFTPEDRASMYRPMLSTWSPHQ